MEIFIVILKIIGYLCVFLLILFLAQYCTKFLAKRNEIYYKGKKIKVIERLYLGKEKEIVLFKYRDKEYLVGLSGNIVKIDAIELKDDLIEEI